MIALYNNYVIRKVSLEENLTLSDPFFKEFVKRHKGFLLIMLKDLKLFLNNLLSKLRNYNIKNIYVMSFNNISAVYVSIYYAEKLDIGKLKSKHNAVIKNTLSTEYSTTICLTVDVINELK